VGLLSGSCNQLHTGADDTALAHPGPGETRCDNHTIERSSTYIHNTARDSKRNHHTIGRSRVQRAHAGGTRTSASDAQLPPPGVRPAVGLTGTLTRA